MAIGAFRSVADNARWVKGLRAAVIAGAMLLVVSWALRTWYLYEAGYLPVQTFNATRWRAVNGRFVRDRTEMIDSLLDSKQLNGLSRAQVLTMLGSSTDTDRYSGWDLVYWLGPERDIFSIDSEWLVIDFGPDGRVSKYDILRD
jgi:hypothetical protein